MWLDRDLGPILSLGSQDSMIFTLMPSTPIWAHMAHGGTDIANRIPTVEHQTIHKLHGSSPLSLEFPWHQDLVALGPTLHDELQYPSAGSQHSNPSWKFVMQRLCNGTQPSYGYLNFIKLYNKALRETKLLNYIGQFMDPLVLLTKNILHPRDQGNDLYAGWCKSDLNSRVAPSASL